MMFRAALVTPTKNQEKPEWIVTGEWTNCDILRSWYI